MSELRAVIALHAIGKGDEDAYATLAGEIVDSAAAQFLEQIAGDATALLHRRIDAAREEFIRERLGALVDDALSASIRRTSRYGEPHGEPLTLRELIVDVAREQLTLRSSRDRDGFTIGRPAQTIVEAFIRREVETTIRRELVKEMDAAKAQVREAVVAEGAEVIRETIRRAGGQT